MPVRVLIVDDSIFIRKRVAEIFAETPDIEVVGQACNGREAVRMVSELQPDVVTMDVEMPEMNGIAAVKQIMRENPTPILMFSVATREGAQATLDALEAGAVDFLPKQLDQINSNRETAKQLFCSRVRMLGQRSKHLKQQLRREHPGAVPVRNSPPFSTSAHRLVTQSYSLLVIAASTGGPVAIQKIVSGISDRLAIPVLLIQHMPGKFTASFAERLNRDAKIEVREARHGDQLRPGLALLAPGGYQLEVQGGGMGYAVSIRESREYEHYQPCADVAFTSIAQHVRGPVLAVVLTGMGCDGTIGAQALKKKGASIWAQNEESCTVYGMPKAIVDANLAERVLGLDEIARAFARL
ncbi:MAG: protein-glutamate methylesterase/protein-glutamine glutaminase [Methylococcales bacterium]